MKKYIYILTFFVLAFFSSCEKSLDSENVSKITSFPLIEVLGEKLITIPVGGPYTDAGAKAFAGTTEIKITTTGTVDVNKPGVYIISYTAENEDGFKATSKRWIGVITSEAKADNLAGKYQRDAGKKGISTWTKVKDGLYKATDVGGAILPDQYVYVFNTEKDIVIVPVQPLGGSGSDASCTNAEGTEKISFLSRTVGDASYKWVIINSGYGTALRTFLKVE